MSQQPLPLPDVQGIPIEMANRPQWVVWRREVRSGKPTKVPYQARRSQCGAMSNNPTTWASLTDAWKCYLDSLAGQQPFDGIGYMFAADDPFVGVDLDKCLADGVLCEWARSHVNQLRATYGEYSPSGTGLHFIARGKLPGGGKKRSGLGPDGDGAIELYDSGRYFAMTGNPYGNPVEIADLNGELSAIYQFALERPKKIQAEEAKAAEKGLFERTATNGPDNEDRAIAYLAKVESAIDGKGGSDVTFRAAIIGHEFGISGDRWLQILLAEYNPRCIGPWTEKELEKKVKDAYGRADKPFGWRVIVSDLEHGKQESTGQQSAAEGAGGSTKVTADRPQVLITTEEHEVNAEVLAALKNDPDLYRFGWSLATIIVDPDPPRGTEYPDGPSPQINLVEPATLREHLTKTTQFFKLKVKGETAEWIPAHPPEFTVNAIHKKKTYPGIRPIEGVIEAPTIRPDGSILSAIGYDAATRLYLQSNVEIDPIPDRPSRADAEQALELIYDLVSDFPFKNEMHKAVWLCGLLSVLGRASFMGPAPLFAFDGNAPGSGKTKLADLIAVIASGRRMPRSTWPSGDHADEEVTKRITSLAVQGERFVLLDNVDCELGGGPMDAAMTGDTWKDRLLGTNNVIAVPLKMIWFASANNIEFRGDFVRRVMLCRLETSYEKPEERTGFKYPQLLEHAVSDRGRILRAGLVILRAHRAAGRPKLVDPLGSFEKWTQAIVDPVRWITGFNPFEVRAEVRVADKGTRTRVALVEGWEELEGGTITGITVADALKQLKDDDDRVRRAKSSVPPIGATPQFQILRDALASLTDRGDLPSTRSIGRFLAGMRGRVIRGKVLQGFEVRSGVFAWKVIDAKTA